MKKTSQFPKRNPNDLEKKSLKIVQKIVLKHAPEKTKIFLFGSRADNTHTHGSDIDIGFLGKKPIDRNLLSQMKEEIEESIVPFKVDLVDFTSQSESFKKIALEKIILWKN